MARLVVLARFTILTQYLQLVLNTNKEYEKPHHTVNVLYVYKCTVCFVLLL